MSDWKELDIENLPADILTGDYEFKSKDKRLESYTQPWEAPTIGERITILRYLEDYDYLYRKLEPKAPTHEEIMTKWWKSRKGDNRWFRVVFYLDGTYCSLGALDTDNAIPRFIHLKRSDFTNRQSADVPPEN